MLPFIASCLLFTSNSCNLSFGVLSSTSSTDRLVNSNEVKHLQYLLSTIKPQVSEYVHTKLEQCCQKVYEEPEELEDISVELKQELEECKKFVLENLNLKKYAP